MIILRLRGGIGNQLFQYAAGKALATHHGMPLKIDDYTYSINSSRKIELSKFKIDFQIASRKEVHKFTGFWPPSRIFHKSTNYRFNNKVCAQPYYHFYPEFFHLPKKIYLSGYWQSEKYFQNITNFIREIYQPSIDLDKRNSDILNKMNKSNSISIHVRRGDYVKTPKYASFFGAQDIEYYKKSMHFLENKFKSIKYFIFSDNPEWCETQFKNVPNKTILTHNQGDQSYLDMWLMSRCKHHIIANSTFSWWGAWLGENPGKTVIAPKRWFKDPYVKDSKTVYYSRYYDIKDLLPESWIRL